MTSGKEWRDATPRTCCCSACTRYGVDGFNELDSLISRLAGIDATKMSEDDAKTLRSRANAFHLYLAGVPGTARRCTSRRRRPRRPPPRHERSASESVNVWQVAKTDTASMHLRRPRRRRSKLRWRPRPPRQQLPPQRKKRAHQRRLKKLHLRRRRRRHELAPRLPSLRQGALGSHRGSPTRSPRSRLRTSRHCSSRARRTRRGR